MAATPLFNIGDVVTLKYDGYEHHPYQKGTPYTICAMRPYRDMQLWLYFSDGPHSDDPEDGYGKGQKVFELYERTAQQELDNFLDI